MSGSTVAALARRDFSLARSYRLSLGFDVAWGVINLLVYFFISKLVTTGVDELGVGSVLLLVRRRRDRDVPGHLRDVHGGRVSRA